jgi:hypothetical protein
MSERSCLAHESIFTEGIIVRRSAAIDANGRKRRLQIAAAAATTGRVDRSSGMRCEPQRGKEETTAHDVPESRGDERRYRCPVNVQMAV